MRIAILGAAPLPVESEQITTGPGIRTWQFAKMSARVASEVLLICLRNEGAYLTQPPTKFYQSSLLNNITYYNLHYDVFTDGTTIKNLIATFKPDVIAGAGTLLPASAAVDFREYAPVWVDFFGDALTEIQAKAQIYQDIDTDTELFHVWKLYRKALTLADKFSVVSAAQRYAVIGQLALCGRLNRHTAGYEFVHIIPCGIDVEEEMAYDAENLSALRGTEFSSDDFVILWAGSYNTWTDVKTLLSGLELAMEKNPKIKYLSIGGATPQYNERVFQQLCQSVSKSKFKERFILKDWVPNHQIPAYFKAANIGISIDRRVYEAELGSRNRILHFLNNSLPVISTSFCELAGELTTQGFVFEFKAGEPESLANVVLSLAEKNNLELRQIGEMGRNYVRKKYSFYITMQEFLGWVTSKPAYAPDNKLRISGKQILNEIERIYAQSEDVKSLVVLKRLIRRVLQFK